MLWAKLANSYCHTSAWLSLCKKGVVISPTEGPQWLWGQPVLRDSAGCGNTWEMEFQCPSHCHAGMGEPCSQWAVVAFGTGGTGSWPRAGLPQLHAVRGCRGIAALTGRVLPARWLWGDPQERFRNLFSRVKFDSKVKWKLWEAGSVFPAVVSQNHSR